MKKIVLLSTLALLALAACTKKEVLTPSTTSSNVSSLLAQPFPVTISCSEPVVSGRVRVKYGTNIYFYATPTGPGYSYKWVVSGQAFIWAHGDTLGFTSQQPGLMTPVYVIVYDNTTGQSSQSQTIKVKWTLH